MSDAGAPLPTPAHLLVRLPNPVGDAVMATPALRALRRALPAATITWAGRPAAQAVLAGLNSERDGVVPISGPLATGARAPFRAGKLLRGLGCDTALLLPNSWSSALEVQRARIAVRVGTNLNRRGGLLTHPVDVPRGDDGRLAPRSMVAHYLALAGTFGAEQDEQGPRLATTPFDEERAARRLADLDASLPLVALNPGAAFGPSKCYPAPRIAAAVRAVRASRSVEVLVLCGPGEEAEAVAVAALLDGPHVTTAQAPPDLGELKALLRRCAVLATTDAGPRHMAEAFGVPTVVGMGPTDPRWSEHSAGVVLRNEGLDCLACHEPDCPVPGHPCMEDLDPIRVAEAILARLL